LLQNNPYIGLLKAHFSSFFRQAYVIGCSWSSAPSFKSSWFAV